MEPLKFTDYLQKILNDAISLNKEMDASGLLLLFDAPIDWKRLMKILGDTYFVAAATNREALEGAQEAGIKTVLLELEDDAPIYDRMSHAILEAVADDFFLPGSRLIALYSGFDGVGFDSLSVINLGEHLERLTGKELRKIETKVPLKTLKSVVDLALEVGREGREGKAVGTLFVVGDTKNVMAMSKAAGFDPVKGYKCKERNLFDSRVREGIKEIAQLDGAFVVSLEGVVVAACRLLDTSTAMITLSKGLGSRHWAAAAISRSTNAVAIAVSQSSGTVRIFINGEVVLRIESRHSRPMVWHEFELDRS
ncbi:MAG: DNA integrity scanning protein DisA nucleotide-binding domain protein [Thermoguttaceae bacterium]|nr:DNA integrity scanning protein DisA nucleotide-binding domain protein [Thermoguttaceae bacterium]MBQ2557130.1 DNA integrity scanning protein DisA nucleotide-binding domain protein [Thermoguttaceae bacterium]MBQ3823130.1 DNA integrity scanning protein DisA nucleotide-binding domain protein [Thermoguttaceae bacterium]MBQ4080430.1 DNA integrity scanning protein DisA nucleotide-binding domain protein [Thermoguttaceae bacterium]MBQ4202214.1 DNA integrity scanning protein DisA nucleotide-binding d